MPGLLDAMYGGGGIPQLVPPADEFDMLRRAAAAREPNSAPPEVLELLKQLGRNVNPFNPETIARERALTAPPFNPPMPPDEYGRGPPQAGANPPIPPALFGSLAGGPQGGVVPGARPVTTVRTTTPDVPIGSQPTSGGPAAPAPAPLAPPSLTTGQPPPGLFDRVGGFLGNNSNALMGLGAGLAGNYGWGQGISAGLKGMVGGNQLDQARRDQNQTVQFLQQKIGMSPQEAAAVAANPVLLQAHIKRAFAQPELVKSPNLLGGEDFYNRDPNTGQLTKTNLNPAPPRNGETRVVNGRTVIFRNGNWYGSTGN